jgi:signal transduction histidine kinase
LQIRPAVSLRLKHDQALTEFAGTLAHELANIFTAAAGNLSLLESSPSGDEIGRMAFVDARRAFMRGFALIAKLKAVAGKQMMSFETTDINRQVAQVVGSIRPTLTPGIALVLKLAENDCIARIDREKFGDALDALIANAREAMEAGGTLTVETGIARGEDGKDYVRVGIRDTGAGLTPEAVAHAACPLATAKRIGPHKGWGLAVCEGFARQCGGFVELESEPGAGTLATLFLPQAKRAG